MTMMRRLRREKQLAKVVKLIEFYPAIMTASKVFVIKKH